jgi:hypothetical protein
LLYLRQIFYDAIFAMTATRTEQEKSMQVSHAEAVRYMSNAQGTLQKAGKEDDYYADPKYVRTACGTAYCGVLLALDTWLTLKGVDMPKKPKRKSIEFYTANIATRDGKLLKELTTVYRILHLGGYYEGECSVPIIQEGFNHAYSIISRIKPEHEITLDELKALKAQKKPAWLRPVYSFFFAWYEKQRQRGRNRQNISSLRSETRAGIGFLPTPPHNYLIIK